MKIIIDYCVEAKKCFNPKAVFSICSCPVDYSDNPIVGFTKIATRTQLYFCVDVT